jgi:hypothetical protein
MLARRMRGSISGYSTQREARGLLELLQHGDTIEAVLELIRVTPREKTVLRAFAIEAPELAGAVERMLAYRIRVEREFTRVLPRRAEKEGLGLIMTGDLALRDSATPTAMVSTATDAST